MPKLEYTEEVLQKVLDRFRNDPELKKHLVQYKMLLRDLVTKEFPFRGDEEKGEYPRIVFYVESKEAAQAVLNAMLEIFPEEEVAEIGSDITPRLNAKVNTLVYYAQGSGGIKEKAQEIGVADTFLEEDGIHFKGDYHLTF